MLNHFLPVPLIAETGTKVLGTSFKYALKALPDVSDNAQAEPWFKPVWLHSCIFSLHPILAEA
jgi:hypothetical protein